MAVDTPVLDRVADERTCAVPSHMDILAEEEHNARIRDTYARLINPESRIEDVFNRVPAHSEASNEQAEREVENSVAPAQPYRVENARADAAIFRADSAVNARREETTASAVAEVSDTEIFDTEVYESEDEDLCPTSTTLQYQTIGVQTEQRTENTKKSFSFSENIAAKFGKKEKIIVAVFVAVVVALIALVIVNSTVIANLNADISKVQDGITTVRGALAGVNTTVEEIIHSSISH